MAPSVRTIVASDIYAWTRAMGMGFLFSMADGYAEYFLGDVDLDRTWGAFDGDAVVGTLRSFPTPFTVPGPCQVDGGRGPHQRHGVAHPRAGGPAHPDDRRRPPSLG